MKAINETHNNSNTQAKNIIIKGAHNKDSCKLLRVREHCVQMKLQGLNTEMDGGRGRPQKYFKSSVDNLELSKALKRFLFPAYKRHGISGNRSS